MLSKTARPATIPLLNYLTSSKIEVSGALQNMAKQRLCTMILADDKSSRSSCFCWLSLVERHMAAGSAESFISYRGTAMLRALSVVG